MNAKIDSLEYEKIGRIKLKDSGFSTKCNEIDAIDILKREGCSIGADIFNVVEEERPSFSSTCYRLTGHFYRKIEPNQKNINDSEIIGNYSYPIDSLSLMNRVKADKTRIRIMKSIEYGIAITLGVLIGLNLL